MCEDRQREKWSLLERRANREGCAGFRLIGLHLKHCVICRQDSVAQHEFKMCLFEWCGPVFRSSDHDIETWRWLLCRFDHFDHFSKLLKLFQKTEEIWHRAFNIASPILLFFVVFCFGATVGCISAGLCGLAHTYLHTRNATVVTECHSVSCCKNSAPCTEVTVKLLYWYSHNIVLSWSFLFLHPVLSFWTHNIRL